MGYQKSWSEVEIVSQINKMAYECRSPHNDGFLSWGIKQDLYQIREILDEAIQRCPKFSGEDEWLKKQEQKKIIKILSS